jgi:hypothetical protein
VATITADGFERLSETAAGDFARAVVDQRMNRPDGPAAALPDVASQDG